MFTSNLDYGLTLVLGSALALKYIFFDGKIDLEVQKRLKLQAEMEKSVKVDHVLPNGKAHTPVALKEVPKTDG